LKKHFEDLVNPTTMNFTEKAESKDVGKDSSIILTELDKVIKKFQSDRAPGVDDIWPK